jgi:hypothetical protein
MLFSLGFSHQIFQVIDLLRVSIDKFPTTLVQVRILAVKAELFHTLLPHIETILESMLASNTPIS